NGDKESAPSAETQTTGPEVADGYTLRKDPEGFRVAVAEGWTRTGKNGSGQVVYAKGDFELIVVPGRDSAAEYGSDPMAYQRDDERELQPYRDSSWATSTGLKSIEVGGRSMAEGQFTWTGSRGDLYVRNLAALIDGRYHVVQVRGPEGERDAVTRHFEQAAATYQAAGWRIGPSNQASPYARSCVLVASRLTSRQESQCGLLGIPAVPRMALCPYADPVKTIAGQRESDAGPTRRG